MTSEARCVQPLKKSIYPDQRVTKLFSFPQRTQYLHMILTYNNNTYLYIKFIQNILKNNFGEFAVKPLPWIDKVSMINCFC